MSRVGSKPIPILPGVTVSVETDRITVRGPRGELARALPPEISVHVHPDRVEVRPRSLHKRTPALWGLTRTLIANMVQGVTEGFQKVLEFEGVGFRANVEGSTLTLQLGFSHPVRVVTPPGIQFSAVKNLITVAGADKELVGNVAAKIRALKPVEPYKGKGIRYQGEVVRRKVGKKAVASA